MYDFSLFFFYLFFCLCTCLSIKTRYSFILSFDQSLTQRLPGPFHLDLLLFLGRYSFQLTSHKIFLSSGSRLHPPSVVIPLNLLGFSHTVLVPLLHFTPPLQVLRFIPTVVPILTLNLIDWCHHQDNLSRIKICNPNTKGRLNILMCCIS